MDVESVDDIVEEILRRLPPDDPASLARAGLVCKRWYRLVSDPHFRRRFRKFHRSAPMLGFICDGAVGGDRYRGGFVPTSSFRPPRTCRSNLVRDARHGRVLLHEWRPKRWPDLVVWDLITNKQQQLPELPDELLQQDAFNWNAAVLCAATADRTCDHLECHHGHFLVVFVVSNFKLIWNYVYSSEAGAWSKGSSAPLAGCRRDIGFGPCALVGSALYFDTSYKSILKYDLETNNMSLIGLPSECRWGTRIVPTTMEEDGLGLACVNGNILHIWSRVVAPEGWAQRRVIELEKLLHIRANPMDVAGFVGSIGVIFVQTKSVCYMINLNSNRITELRRDDYPRGIFPYINFCTPGGCAEDDDANDTAGHQQM